MGIVFPEPVVPKPPALYTARIPGIRVDRLHDTKGAQFR